MVLYGLGVTVGAGIYVLIGEVIARAGDHAPVAFLISGLVMLLPAACFAELTGRLPYAAAVAHFVEAGFGSRHLFLLVGLAVVAVGVVSSAAIALGAAGYLGELVDLPAPVLAVAAILTTGCVAVIGIRESVAIAGVLTLVEVGGLAAVVAGALWAGADLPAQALASPPPSADPALWGAILGSSLIAFFAFIGFEDIASIAEETVAPQRTLAHGIFLTLALTLVIYFAVLLAALASVPREALTDSTAPLAEVFAHTTGLSPVTIALIAVVATVNGIIVQMIMASRVLYGLADRGALPGGLGTALRAVHPATGTPVRATVLVVALVLVLALAFPITGLAEGTSTITLVVFMLAAAALIRIKRSGVPAPEGTVVVPGWVPWGAILACGALLVGGLAGG
ncbi:Amino acid permease superfamily [Polymorphum gilvum SL003B-26A1]|uniref:Amino acid permease superfamily n=1 Tax=Polymorphum gilvum (strain LMG 25793 / CGMCC 1.9160 / SL003B-26A1) TaxID=991905 RepID=F2J019_POLGS|nr:Amino acid permease superfamily [Polymorphum gilvum SL003B-26A1]